MSETVVTRLTFADLERLPDSPCRQELLHALLGGAKINLDEILA